MKNPTRWTLGVALAVVSVLAISFGGTVIQMDPAEPSDSPSATATEAQSQKGVESAEETVYVNYAGVQVAVDPQTGRLRPPNAREARLLAAAIATRFRAHGQPQLTEHADGNLSAVLFATGCKLSVLVRNEDGTIKTTCVGSPDGAKAFIKAAANTPANDTK